MTVKYYSESEKSKTPALATSDTAGYDLYAAESKTILSQSVKPVSLELRWVVPKDFYGKTFPRSGILIKKLSDRGCWSNRC